MAGLLSAGCQGEAIVITNRPLVTPRQVPANVVIEPIHVSQTDFLLDAESNRYKPATGWSNAPWVKADRLGELCRAYFEQAGLFQSLQTRPSLDGPELSLLCRPQLAVRQYIRPSISGTMLTFGTGLIYALLGGSACYRYVEVELVLDVRSSTGRAINTYVAVARTDERLATDGRDQLGPLISQALTRALEEATRSIATDNDLLMQALSADIAAKGARVIRPAGAWISVSMPKGILVRSPQVTIAGMVSGVTEPVTLEWALGGKGGGLVPLTATAAPSARSFSFETTLPEGVARIALTLRRQGGHQSGQVAGGQGGDGGELSRTELAYLCVPETDKGGKLPEVRQRWAVVIGISQYAHGGQSFPNLRFAQRDARAFADFLLGPRSGGFAPQRVMCLLDKDATAANVRHALFEFLAQAGKDDLVVIFFSGHGMPEPGTDNFFMLCHDTRPDRLASTGFPMWDIETALRRFVKAERVVVLADACHAGVISTPPGAKAGAENPVHQYLHQLALAQPGRLIFTASEARELSYESEKWGGGHGAFTWCILEGLSGKADRNRDGVVSTGELIDYVQEAVKGVTDGRQHPNPAGQFDRRLPLGVVLEEGGK